MSGEEVTKPREPKLFQKQLGVLVEDADYCLSAARERFGDAKLYGLLVPVTQALVWDAAEVIEDQALTLGQFDDQSIEELAIPTLVLQLKSMLKGFEEELEKLDEDMERHAILETCTIAGGELRRGILTLEKRMSRLFGVPPHHAGPTDLESGLRLRRLYVRFDRAVRGLSENPKRFDLVGKLVNNLKSSEGWSAARATDRLRMANLLDSLETSEPSWDDVVSFSRALRQIRWRVEIREHDLALIEQVLDSVRSKSVATSIDEDFLTGIEPVRYLSDELDEIFQRGTSATYGEWKYQLEMTSDVIAQTPNRNVNEKTSELNVVDA